MPLRSALFLGVQLIAILSFAQVKLSNGQRDSILRSPLMQYRLQQDSSGSEDAYFIRRSRVWKEIEIHGEYLDTTVYNCWGAPVTIHSYLNGKLRCTIAVEYNAHGNMAVMHMRYYYKGELDHVSTYHYFYMPLPDGKGELLTKMLDSTDHYAAGVLKHNDTSSVCYEYNVAYQRVRKTKTGTEPRCVSPYRRYKLVTTYSYNDAGQLIKEETYKDGTCQVPESTTVEILYDKNGREISRTTMSGGAVTDVVERSYNSDGRIGNYQHHDYTEKSEYASDNLFLGNGLIRKRLVVYRGKESTAEYEYIYYPNK